MTDIAERAIALRRPRGLAEETPGIYKDIDAVVNAAEVGVLARKVARLEPLINAR